MAHKLTINDLPIECHQEILEKLTDRTDRMLTRFVCRLWRDLINRDSSSECYRCYPFSLKQDHRQNERYLMRDLVPVFREFQRKLISFRINANLEGSEQFWKEKSANKIIALYFERGCSHRIPFVEITKYCQHLQILSIDLGSHVWTENQICSDLEKCLAVKSVNYSVHTLYLQYVYKDNFIKVAQLINRVFLRLRNVFFEYVQNLDLQQDYNAEAYGQSLISGLKDINFVLTFSRLWNGEFEYNPSNGQFPLKIRRMKMGPNADPFCSYISRCSRSPNTDLNELLYYCEELPDGQLQFVADVIFTEYPSLKKLEIRAYQNDQNIILEFNKPLRQNQLECLELDWSDIARLFTINKPFLQSFANLKLFHCDKLSYRGFLKVLNRLEKLEELHVSYGSVNVNKASVKSIISRNNLINLTMPSDFLIKTAAKYNFNRLKKLCIIPKPYDRLNEGKTCIFKMDRYLKRMNCPNLKMLGIGIGDGYDENYNTSKELRRFMLNIMALFPTLVTIECQSIFIYEIPLSDEILVKILKKRPNFKKISTCKCDHNFNRISPSHIEYLCHFKIAPPTTSLVVINN